MKIKVSPLPLHDALLLGAFEAHDERGGIVKVLEGELCKKLKFGISEVLLSENVKGAMRGMHYQNPKAQAKIVWCLSGKIYDVIVDMRKSSPTYGKWHAVELEKNKNGIYIPEGFAHGFCSLEEGSTLLYLISGEQDSSCEHGFNLFDKEIAVKWPKVSKQIISERDRKFPAFKDVEKYE